MSCLRHEPFCATPELRRSSQPARVPGEPQEHAANSAARCLAALFAAERSPCPPDQALSSSSTASPYRSSFAAPMPLTPASASRDCGRSVASARRVASPNTT